jgi:hypothetical protein
MAKKKGGKSKGYVSSGQVGTNRQLKKQARREWMVSWDRLEAQRSAWKKGKRVMLTIPNPNQSETKKPFVRVEAKTVWGDPRAKNKEDKHASA